ncbi:sigma-54-dependent Fis family transcriptional regulator [Methylocystis sp. FS]|uniref:sigma-54-dependent transcriptional regulator n=1 Tax=Methylocystis silviterrae TaxID=2743612 RepID=UPI0015819AD1|nr:sigma-54 dependent transcriptional regulator [Methylocystis silviterrae]NUJ79150.1 sigma-54-dependent Fis family transcriptional regulator [Methylocystis silviterrae]
MKQVAKAKVLVVEDVSTISRVYCAFLERAGYAVATAASGSEGISKIKTESPGVVILDLNLPDMRGLETLQQFIASAGSAIVIVATSEGSIKVAVDAMRFGAYDFVVKPVSAERMVTSVQQALEHSILKAELKLMRENFSRDTFCGFIGKSFAMQAVYRSIESVAASDATVFITGESGTGKELAAEAIHKLGRRSAKPFVAINCGAIPRELISSELFGHVKGSFTGAIADRAGAVKQADGGTLFLDEICEMQLDLQPELLRFLQMGTFRAVGSARAENVDVRVVCATNRDPLAEVSAGRFREDLYYRLHVIPLSMPPLRDRDEDVLEIAEEFLARFSEREGKTPRSLSGEAAEKLLAYSWPGNVRQLQNVIRNVIVMNDAQIIDAPMLAIPDDTCLEPQPEIRPAKPVTSGLFTPRASLDVSTDESSDRVLLDPWRWKGTSDVVPLDVIERVAIERTIQICDGNIPRAATYLGLSPSTIYRKRELKK